MMRDCPLIARNTIESFEQPRLKAYQGAADAPGIFTIGIGHLITGLEKPDIFKPGQMMRDVSITKEQMYELFSNDIKTKINAIYRRLPAGLPDLLTENEFSAVLSFIFNVGEGGFEKSNLKQNLILKDNTKAAYYFKSFVTSNKQRQNGLVRRRACEKALFLSDMDNYFYFLNDTAFGTKVKAPMSTIISKALTYLEL